MGAALVLASCEKVQEVKSLEIERTSGIHQAEAWSEFIQGTGTVNAIGDEAYYQNLRDWKKAAFDADGITTRSIVCINTLITKSIYCPCDSICTIILKGSYFSARAYSFDDTIKLIILI